MDQRGTASTRRRTRRDSVQRVIRTTCTRTARERRSSRRTLLTGLGLRQPIDPGGGRTAMRHRRCVFARRQHLRERLHLLVVRRERLTEPLHIQTSARAVPATVARDGAQNPEVSYSCNATAVSNATRGTRGCPRVAGNGRVPRRTRRRPMPSPRAAGLDRHLRKLIAAFAVMLDGDRANCVVVICRPP